MDMYIDFTILSENADCLSIMDEYTGLRHTSFLKKGDKLRSGNIINYNEWSYKSNNIKSMYIDDIISVLKSYIGKRIQKLSHFIKKNKLQTSICIVIRQIDEGLPSLAVSRENIYFLFALDASIDFDFI